MVKEEVCRHYEMTLDGVLRQMRDQAPFFQVKPRANKLRGVWTIVETWLDGEIVQEAEPDSEGVEIVGWGERADL